MINLSKGQLMILAIVLAAIIGGLVSVHYLGNDNPVEQIAEQVITKETGATVNLDSAPATAVPQSAAKE
jgi:hypothetical protein